ncbi:hypothetical protein ACQEU5_08005 [Marinactinospora thermotolerans]|uniref:Uncharacterized protein n=1 Tax=Marinactinospora thermotolerans DSM 45154 TaxID=1122192 RepID=A0A1T4R8J4_9ACTN|nr:hypothetical protein [Marinactinospora thermotolerans]SKA12237.1 hypothetical protein SAMN02745673_02605 [Marinactinospora thermotolerans DSM 45154]
MKRGLPVELKAVRLLLFITAGLTLLAVVGALMVVEVDAVILGELTWVALPGVLALVFALRLPRGGRVLFWGIAVLQVLTLLLALGNLPSPSALTQMLLPLLTLGLLTRARAREALLSR